MLWTFSMMSLTGIHLGITLMRLRTRVKTRKSESSSRIIIELIANNNLSRADRKSQDNTLSESD